MQEAQPKDQPATEEPKYGVVEIFGHRQHAGRVLEVEQFGAKMLRIDVPKTDNEGVASFDNGYETHFYGGGSIFSFSPATLETVIRMNKTYPSAGMRSLPFYDAPDDDDEPEDETAAAKISPESAARAAAEAAGWSEVQDGPTYGTPGIIFKDPEANGTEYDARLAGVWQTVCEDNNISYKAG